MDSPQSSVLSQMEVHKVTAKFELEDSYTIAQVYDSNISVADIRLDLASKFQLDVQYLQLWHQSLGVCSDHNHLHDLPPNRFSIVEFRLMLSDAALAINNSTKNIHKHLRLDTEIFFGHYHLPEFSVVHIDQDNEQNDVAKRLIVEIVNKPIQKHFIGGYRNTKTNIEYHNAVTQTGPPLSSIRHDNISQSMQTKEIKHMTNSTFSSQASSTSNALALVKPNCTIVAKPYENAEQMEIRIDRLSKIILIQRNVRRFLLRRLIREAAKEYRRRVAKKIENTKLFETQQHNLFVKDCVINTFPKTREDFNLLKVQIHKWKETEIQRINGLAWGGTKIAMLHAVLNKEIQLLNAVDRKENEQCLHNVAEKTDRRLDDMGKPVKWVGYKNGVCQIDLLRTQKIRQLVSMYRQLKAPTQSITNRVKLLDETMKTLQNETFASQTKQLLDLMVTERTILTRSTTKLDENNLKPLRMRQQNLMVIHIETFNTGISNISNKSKEQTNILCKQCNSVKPITQFQLNTRQKEVNVCMKCTQLKGPPTDFTCYREILRSIQRSERRLGALSSYAFIARDNDIRELVNTIWHSQSVLSQANAAHGNELQLPRWRKGDEWSPWNCVCLTVTEALAHVKLQQPDELYDQALIAKVERKHDLTRLMFSKMNLVNSEFVESNEWWNPDLKNVIE